MYYDYLFSNLYECPCIPLIVEQNKGIYIGDQEGTKLEIFMQILIFDN